MSPVLKYSTDIDNQRNKSSLKTSVFWRRKMRKKIVEALLQLGVIVNLEDVDNPGILNTAVEKGSLEIVEDLLEYGADVNMSVKDCSTGLTPLHSAVKGKQEEMARLLIYYGANVIAEDSKGKTPVAYAIENSDTKMIELLLNNGAAMKEDYTSLCIAVEKGNLKFVEDLLKSGAFDYRLLHLAVKGKQVEMVKLLINYGANVNVKHFERETPIVYAIKERDTKMIELLLNNGADLKGDPMVLITAIEQGSMKMVEDLLKDGANVNMLVNDYMLKGLTPLHSAVKAKQVEMARLLIYYGANVNAEDYTRKTALNYALENYDTEMIELLKTNGATTKNDPYLLCTFVKNGILEMVEAVLKNGTDVNMKNSSWGTDKTLLRMAVDERQVEMAKLLLKYGASINVEDWEGITPICSAIRNNDTEMVKLLLNNGIDMKEDPWSLWFAVEKGNLIIVEDLLKYGADVNVFFSLRFGRITILHVAVRWKQVEVAKLLINYGANVNLKDSNRETPIVYAIKKRDTKMTELLLINGADIKEDPKVLCTAVKKGSLKVVEILLKDGADVNLIDNSKSRGGVTLLHSAVLAKQVEMAKLLINYGANVNAKDGHGRTPICYAMLKNNTKMTELLLINGADIKEDPRVLCTAVKNGSLKVVEDLLKDGADANLIDDSKLIGGVTLLHSAVRAKQVEMAELLINYGANVNVQDSRGKTPIGDAMLKNNTEMAELLFINGADIKEDPRLLFTAVKSRSLIIVEDLLKDGADVNTIDNSNLIGGITLLHSAVLGKQVEMAKLLINYGATVNVKDYEGTTPIGHAIKNRDAEMTKLLLINGADITEDPYLLFTAVKNGSLKIVEYLLEDCPDVINIDYIFDEATVMLLHSAVNGRQVEMAKLLINYGANVNGKDSEGTTPLGYAIENRDTKMTELLLINGADIKDDPNVLCTAVKQGCMKIVEDLLKYGADVNMLTTARFGSILAPLHCAVNGRQVEMAKLLINYGANVNVKDSEGKTPIVYAIDKRDTNMTELLLINGADIKEDRKLLITAVEKGSLIVVEHLLKDGADVNLIDNSISGGGVTLLHSAVHAKQVEMAKLLINYGACVNVKDFVRKTPVAYAIWYGDIELVQLLLVNGYDINNDSGALCIAVENGSLKFAEVLLSYVNDVNILNTLPFKHFYILHYAVQKMQVRMAELLINYGANVNVKDREGKTPIVYAIEKRDTKMIELLLINGANIKEDPKVLCTAVKNGSLKIVEDLLKNGTDVNMRDKSNLLEGMTLLHSAVLGKQVEMAKLLINYGANVNVKDCKGETPIDYAIENGDTKMTELLLINGANMKENLRVLCTNPVITKLLQ